MKLHVWEVGYYETGFNVDKEYVLTTDDSILEVGRILEAGNRHNDVKYCTYLGHAFPSLGELCAIMKTRGNDD